MSSAEWQTGDPREQIDKQDTILIVDGTTALVGFGQTKHSYYIELDREMPGGRDRDLKWIGPDHTWPADWKWIRYPAVQ